MCQPTDNADPDTAAAEAAARAAVLANLSGLPEVLAEFDLQTHCTCVTTRPPDQPADASRDAD